MAQDKDSFIEKYQKFKQIIPSLSSAQKSKSPRKEFARFKKLTRHIVNLNRTNFNKSPAR